MASTASSAYGPSVWSLPAASEARLSPFAVSWGAAATPTSGPAVPAALTGFAPTAESRLRNQTTGASALDDSTDADEATTQRVACAGKVIF